MSRSLCGSDVRFLPPGGCSASADLPIATGSVRIVAQGLLELADQDRVVVVPTVALADHADKRGGDFVELDVAVL